MDDCPLLTFPQLKQALGADPEALPATLPQEALLLLQLLPVAADSPAAGSGAGAGRRVWLEASRGQPDAAPLGPHANELIRVVCTEQAS